MNKIRVTVCGTSYTLSTEDSEEYVRGLATRVERAVKEMMQNPRVSLSMAAVLTAMDNADAAEKAQQAADHLRAQMKEYLDDNAKIRTEADRLRQENTLLRQKLAIAERR